MNNIQIKTKVYTNAIIEEIRRVSGKTMHYFGIVSDIVKDILSDEKTLDAIVTCAWDEDEKQGVCAFTPEQLLELAPHGFNPCPIELFLNGSMSLEDAIEECFSVTMSSVWNADEWAENSGDGLEKLDFDLFECTCGNGKEDKWLATDKEGTPLCELSPDCREKATKEEKNGQTKSNYRRQTMNNLTEYEKKCASKLAHAFYDYDPERQKDLPPFKEVLSVAKELIHHENTCEWRERLRREKGTPLMPGNGFDYVGVEYYLEKGTEYCGNLRESLKACMRSTYEALEGN